MCQLHFFNYSILHPIIVTNREPCYNVGMDERSFVDKKRADWDRLAALIVKAGGIQGVRNLTREEIKELGPLYRRTSSDLAFSRSHATSTDLIAHPNGLLGAPMRCI